MVVSEISLRIQESLSVVLVFFNVVVEMLSEIILPRIDIAVCSFFTFCKGKIGFGGNNSSTLTRIPTPAPSFFYYYSSRIYFYTYIIFLARVESNYYLPCALVSNFLHA